MNNLNGMYRSRLMHTAKVKKKKNSSTFSVIKLYNKKENGVLVSLTLFFCLGCVEVPAIQTYAVANKVVFFIVCLVSPLVGIRE